MNRSVFFVLIIIIMVKLVSININGFVINPNVIVSLDGLTIILPIFYASKSLII